MQYLMFYFDSDTFVSLPSPLCLSCLCTALFHSVVILPNGNTLNLGFFIAFSFSSYSNLPKEFQLVWLFTCVQA